MPTTPLGLPYPTPADSPTGAAAAIEALAEATEAQVTAVYAQIAAARNIPAGMATSAAQPILKEVAPVPLTLAGELLDTANMVDLTSQPQGITVPADGWYFVYAHTEWQTNAAGLRTTAIMLNGQTSQTAWATEVTPQVFGWAAGAQDMLACKAGDLVQVGASHTLGIAGLSALTVTFCSLLVFRIA